MYCASDSIREGANIARLQQLVKSSKACTLEFPDSLSFDMKSSSRTARRKLENFPLRGRGMFERETFIAQQDLSPSSDRGGKRGARKLSCALHGTLDFSRQPHRFLFALLPTPSSHLVVSSAHPSRAVIFAVNVVDEGRGYYRTLSLPNEVLSSNLREESTRVRLK